MAATTTVSDVKASRVVNQQPKVAEVALVSFDDKDALRYEMWEKAQDLVREWSKKAPFEDDDGLTPPSLTACRTAFEFLCKLELRLPDHIFHGQPVPDGDGGIAFNARKGQCTDRYEINSAGDIHQYYMESSRVVFDRPIYLD